VPFAGAVVLAASAAIPAIIIAAAITGGLALIAAVVTAVFSQRIGTINASQQSLKELAEVQHEELVRTSAKVDRLEEANTVLKAKLVRMEDEHEVQRQKLVAAERSNARLERSNERLEVTVAAMRQELREALESHLHCDEIIAELREQRGEAT
jgi:predicted RNase H-like nuclease (RuvC/YqgF family)